MSNLDKPASPTSFEGFSDFMGSYIGFNGGLTKREQAAITLRIPMSGDEELDKMILVSRRLDIAVLQLRMDWGSEVELRDALRSADALLKEAGL